MPDSANSIAHLQHLSQLLKMELAYEQETYRHALTPDHISGRLHEAGCHYPVEVGNAEYNALNQLVVTISFEQDEDAVENDFEPGKPVHFFHLDEGGQGLAVMRGTCFVERVGDGCISVRLPERSLLPLLRETARQHLMGVQLGIDTTSYQVMQEALASAIHSTNERFITLRETLIGTRKPAFGPQPRVLFPWLNTSQNEAVQKVIEARQVAVVHGPPGTGKTTTLVEAIIETLQREMQVMVCAPSNTAVDWISEQLMRRGIPVLRIGNPLRMSDEMLDCSYERRYAAHPDYPELWSIRRMLRGGTESKGKSLEKQAKLQKMRQRQTELEIKINSDLFNQARVVSCTLIGSAYHILERRRFSTLFIDEAAQALEPACWAAILKCDRVILGGDHQQLPPTVKNPQAARQGLDRTLMQHLVSHKPECVTLLNTQYRMNQSIMQFSSQWFYHGSLQAAPQVAHQLVSPMDTPLTWIDTSNLGFGEHTGRHTPTRTNAEEARLLIQTLRDYVDSIGMPRLLDDAVDFGIISPYRGQVRLLRRMLRSQRGLFPLRRHISIHTIDGFQGQERDVIILSMVRDNDAHNIGFLRDLRRMNVAITRARMKLIIVGNTDTLSRHPFYAQLIAHFEQYGNLLRPLPTPSGDIPSDTQSMQ